MIINDTYKTIKSSIEGDIFKDKNSKFIAFVFPVNSEEDVKKHIESIKKKHYAARHWCYAYRIGTETFYHRINDDGEPSNSAGAPIYGQILSFDLTNTLIIVVRYYGGIKLGVGGLINAYKTASKIALDRAEIIEKTIDVFYNLNFDYKHMSKVMRILDVNGAKIINQRLEIDCNYKIGIRKSKSDKLKQLFEDFYGVNIKAL